MSTDVRIALVGYGYWGPNLARNIHTLSGATLAMCCDQNPRALARAKALYPWTSTCTDYSEVLGNKEVDAVVIATPVNTHYELAREALLRGKHVLVEKPLAATVSQGEELTELAHQKGLTLMVGPSSSTTPR